MKALIVDDEIYSIRAIKSAVDWERIGINEVLTAFDARSGRRMCMENQIDVIISDIEMPDESGMDFLQWVHEQREDTIFIFISCHEEFSYARDAMKLNCFSYLVKPIDFQELEGEIERGIRQLEKNRQTRTQSRLGEYWNRNKDVVSREWWRRLLLSNDGKEAEEIVAEAGNYGVSLDLEPDYFLVLIRLCKVHTELGRWDYLKVLRGIQNISYEIFCGDFSLSSGCMIERDIIIIGHGKDSWKRVDRDSKRCVQESAQLLGAEVRVSVQEPSYCEELWEKYKELLLKEHEKDARGTTEYENLTNMEEIVRQAEHFVRSHLDQPITRGDVASSVHLNPDYLNRILKKERGCTISDYVIKEKLKKAEELLCNESLSVSEVAMQVGIQNFSYFSNVFKKETGCTPKEYRIKKRSRSEF